jgi:predicted nucleic acid-binding protein
MLTSSCVLDSWAVVALLQNEPAASEVESLIRAAQQTGAALWTTVVNLGEVWYTIARSRSSRRADGAVEEIRALGLRVRDADWNLTREAARLKSHYRLSYAGCFAAALARQLDAELVTGDPEFRRLEQEVRIRWL